MKERLLEFLRAENKSSAQLAEEIGVQASGISHILSGRNNPSLDFVLKMLEKYKFISSDWLLFGKGQMYKEHSANSLFNQNTLFSSLNYNDPEPEKAVTAVKVEEEDKKQNTIENPDNLKSETGKRIRRLVWFYDDNTFEEFYPQ